MMDPVVLMRTKIKEALGEMSFAVAAERSGGRLTKSSLHNWVSGKTTPGIDSLVDIGAITGHDLSFFLPGSPDEDVVFVRKLDIAASAGGGAWNGAAPLEETLPFPRWMIDKLAPGGARLSLLRARGDSMEPLIRDGALLLVDARDREPKKARKPPAATRPGVRRGSGAGDIFVFSDGDALLVKHLRRDRKGNTIVVSENPEWEPEVLDPREARIHGRVVWWDNDL